MNQNSSFTMEPFPSIPGRHAAEWSSRLALIYSYALTVCTGQQGGLMGFILSPALYLLDYGQPFVPYDHPGQPPAANATAGTWSAHNNAMNLWQRESTAIASLMETIFQSLDRVSSAWFFEPLRNRYNRNPENFFFIMNCEYGVPDTTTISEWIRQLQVTMSAESNVRDIVSSHRALHSQLNKARGYVMTEDDAVNALLQAINIPILGDSIVLWLTQYRGAANHTFNNLADYLIQIETGT
jgi:hypothetical protein